MKFPLNPGNHGREDAGTSLPASLRDCGRSPTSLSVPDGDLYELVCWPSLFNPERSWALVSHNLLDIIPALEGPGSWSARLQDDHDDRRRAFFRGWPRFSAARTAWSRFRLRRKWPWALPALDRICGVLRAPVDQTLGKAVAQIIVVAKRRAG
jgi:hypothetical protein